MLDYQGPRCALCGVALAYLEEGQGVMTCPFCCQFFHSDCLDGHSCAEMREAGEDKLAEWTAATQGWQEPRRG
jgi:hypothetical protein